MIHLLNQQINKLPGYKISNSHFRLGSKIHISDFYYAKRFFQNHFFASRFAFLVAKEIFASLAPEHRQAIRNRGLSLIGYGVYSELLLSLVTKFLKTSNCLETSRINHHTILDSQELQFVKSDPLHGNAIIVVPIASTFTTTLKIEEALKEKKNDLTILPPHYNLLYIADGEESNTLTVLEKEFGWTKKDPDHKTITLTAYQNEQEAIAREQRYFLCLPSAWEKIEDCQLCFPVHDEKEDLLREKPLLETDRTSVTPIVIFDYPKGRTLSPAEEQRKGEIKPKLVHYGHHIRNHSHFIYAIDTEGFLQMNHTAVKEWLRSFVSDANFRATFSETARILLVSSCHHSNATFINLVNEELFSSAANIIHYDPAQDYIQNFDLVYGNEIKAADKIIFVDDSLKTGATFTKINDFISYTLANQAGYSSSEVATKGIDACFFLINKAQPFTLYLLKERLVNEKQVHAFSNVHLFTSLANESVTSLELEEKRYQQLFADSFLDSLKIHFSRQVEKLSIRAKDHSDPVKRERHLLMLDVTHRLYAYFSTVPTAKDTINQFDDLYKFGFDLPFTLLFCWA